MPTGNHEERRERERERGDEEGGELGKMIICHIFAFYDLYLFSMQLIICPVLNI